MPRGRDSELVHQGCLALLSQRRSLGKPRGKANPEALPGQGVTLEVEGRC